MCCTATVCALVGVPGFKPFTGLLVKLYGFYGDSVSTMGIAIGASWGLIEGFVHFGVFAWLYNMLLGRGVSAFGSPNKARKR